MKAILISPGFGAGWSTWMHDGREAEEFALTYDPLISALLAGLPVGSEQDVASPLGQFVRDYADRFGDRPYVGGARGLTVVFVDDDAHFLVEEYDGSESVRLRDATPWYDARTVGKQAV